ncbi:MAG TPA: YebC/PmpR family DNA-binding transcriptional regulator [Bacteroidetes bacterium]|nr:YebC/PmpR family DNA-binding transcriptional regulator [Bacteroidota bacterium]
MSGHSKWATIRRKKEKLDAARGRVFSGLIKEITIAARMGGGDPNGNPRLRTAIETAKAANMPASNIDRAIKKGTGDLPGVTYEEITYEAYGPGGTALLIEVFTDNRNRTLSEIRHLLGKNGANLAETGSVGWMFNRQALVTVPADEVDENEMLTVGLDAGADDISLEDDFFQISAAPEKLDDIRRAVEEAGFKVDSCEVVKVPQTEVMVEGTHARQLLRLMEMLEEHDDVQKVWSNFDIPEEMLEDG